MASVQFKKDWQSKKKTALERNRHMFNNSDMSDIRFTCEGSDKIFYAHKYVLGTNSSVFRAMFYGGIAENGPAIHLPDTNEEGLEQFLWFLYTEECSLSTDNVYTTMYLAHKYITTSLYEECVNFLLEILNSQNALEVLEQATRFEEKELEQQCLKVIQFNTIEVLASRDAFNNISKETLIKILELDTLNIAEVKLFQVVLTWIDFQCSRQNLERTGKNRRFIIGDVIYSFRLFSMTKDEFLENVPETGLLTSDELVPVLAKFLDHNLPGLKWTLPNRRRENTVRFCRFPGKTKKFRTSWEYGGAADRLRFFVNKEVFLLGVRLFGEQESKYLVTFEVAGAKVTRSYTSERNQDDIPGFDVMLNKPVPLKQNEDVTLSATIKGPDSCSGENGISSVDLEGVTMTFMDTPCATNKTCKNRGQFHEIILSI